MPLKVEYWYEARNALEAYKLIEQMRARSIVLTPYLDQRMVDDIYKVGTPGRVAIGWGQTWRSYAPEGRAAIIVVTSYNPSHLCLQTLGVEPVVEQRAPVGAASTYMGQQGRAYTADEGYVEDEEGMEILPDQDQD